jgi:hypothetical protein
MHNAGAIRVQQKVQSLTIPFCYGLEPWGFSLTEAFCIRMLYCNNINPIPTPSQGLNEQHRTLELTANLTRWLRMAADDVYRLRSVIR